MITDKTEITLGSSPVVTDFIVCWPVWLDSLPAILKITGGHYDKVKSLGCWAWHQGSRGMPMQYPKTACVCVCATARVCLCVWKKKTLTCRGLAAKCDGWMLLLTPIAPTLTHTATQVTHTVTHIPLYTCIEFASHPLCTPTIARQHTYIVRDTSGCHLSAIYSSFVVGNYANHAMHAHACVYTFTADRWKWFL